MFETASAFNLCKFNKDKNPFQAHSTTPLTEQLLFVDNENFVKCFITGALI